MKILEAKDGRNNSHRSIISMPSDDSGGEENFKNNNDINNNGNINTNNKQLDIKKFESLNL